MLNKNIDKIQQCSKCRLWGDIDETINHIKNDTCKLSQKDYKTRHDSVGNMIHGELRKKLKSNHMNTWYMHNPESVQENETRKIRWDFEIQTDHLFSARRQVNKIREPTE